MVIRALECATSIKASDIFIEIGAQAILHIYFILVMYKSVLQIAYVSIENLPLICHIS